MELSPSLDQRNRSAGRGPTIFGASLAQARKRLQIQAQVKTDGCGNDNENTCSRDSLQPVGCSYQVSDRVLDPGPTFSHAISGA